MAADAVSLDLNGIDDQINALDQNTRHLATSSDMEAAREQAREAARVAVRSMLPSLRTALENEAASMAATAPTADTVAALIATAVSDGVASMQQRLAASARGHVQTAAAAARTEAEGRACQGAQRALAELRCRLAETEALLDRDVHNVYDAMPRSLRPSVQWRDDSACDSSGNVSGGRGELWDEPYGKTVHIPGTVRWQADISEGSAAAVSTATRMAATLRQYETLRLQLTRAAEELELGVQGAFRSDVAQSVAARFADRHRLLSLSRRLTALETEIKSVHKAQVRRGGSESGDIQDHSDSGQLQLRSSHSAGDSGSGSDSSSNNISYSKSSDSCDSGGCRNDNAA